MSKRRIIFIILLSLTLIYPLLVNRFVEAYSANRAAALNGYPVEMRGYVDFGPFTGSLYGFLTILFGACIVVSWSTLFLWRK